MTHDEVEAFKIIETAKTAEDVFGPLSGVKSDVLGAIAQKHKALAKLIHPDKHHGAARAETAFRRLQDLRSAAEDCVNGGAPLPRIDSTVVETKKRKYTLTSVIARGDLADLYRATYDKHSVVMKVARHAGDNDLLENEAKVVKALRPTDGKPAASHKLLPRLVDAFSLRAKGKPPRQVNVFSNYEDYRALVDVQAAYPKGIDFRDMIWMWKRALMALGFAHRVGYVHGAVLPVHVLVHPEHHGAKLVDWCYAARVGVGYIAAISTPFEIYYPPEVLKKGTPEPGTDMFMLAKCMIGVLGGDVAAGTMPSTVPSPIQGFLKSCLFASPNRRPKDAWKLHEELDALLADLIGRPKFRVLDIPTRKGA